MHPTVEALVLDLLEWVGDRARPYAEVIDAWRTSCPRLTVWEDAIDDGLVVQKREGRDLIVTVTERGEILLRAAGREICKPGAQAPARR